MHEGVACFQEIGCVLYGETKGSFDYKPELFP